MDISKIINNWMHELKTREMDSKYLVVVAATSIFMVNLTLGSPWLLWEMPLFCGASCTAIGIEKNLFSG